MKKLYHRTVSFPAVFPPRRLVVVILALGGAFMLMRLSVSSPSPRTAPQSAEEAFPSHPQASWQEALRPAVAWHDRLLQLLSFPTARASATAQFASFLPSLTPRAHALTIVPAAYPTLEEFEHQFEELARKYPRLVRREIIGTSSARKRPIWAFRVTDNPEQDEDEPAVLFSALHHAREPAGVFICKALIEDLVQNYGGSARHTRLLDSLDIWIVPLVNPDGYKYLLENRRQFPWWRKNLRDNDGDGVFDPLIDGVDLNRNYDYNWEEGGEGEHGSWFYRGKQAFSETEIQALRDLELRRNFLLGVSFHSYGEAVLYPWGNFNPPPDHDLILDIAESYARQIGRVRERGTYGVLPLNGRVGQSSVWMYGASSVIDFICETGEDYFPAFEELPHIVAENVRGATYVLERALRSGLAGHVRDAQTGAPLEAEISVAGREATYVKPRHSSGPHGRFDRLLLPGVYTIAIHKSGYRSERFERVLIRDNTLTKIEVALQREAARPSVTSH